MRCRQYVDSDYPALKKMLNSEEVTKIGLKPEEGYATIVYENLGEITGFYTFSVSAKKLYLTHFYVTLKLRKSSLARKMIADIKSKISSVPFIVVIPVKKSRLLSLVKTFFTVLTEVTKDTNVILYLRA